MPERRRAVAGGPPQRRSQAQVVEDHGADLEDELLGRVEGLLHEPAQGLDLVAGARVALDQEALHDLGLQADVGDRLRRSVVELAHDVAAQVLLAAQRQDGLVEAGRGAAAGGHGQGPKARRGHGCRPRGQAAPGGQAVVDLDEPLEEAGEDALLALEHLALGIEEELATRQRQEARADLVDLGPVRRGRWPRASPAGPRPWLAAPRAARPR